MKKIILLLYLSTCFVFLIKTNTVHSANYTTISRGSWLTSANWSGGADPAYNLTPNGIITIDHGITITAATFRLANGTTLNINSGDTLTITGNLQLDNGCFLNVSSNAYLIIIGNVDNQNNSNNITINGTIKINGDFTGGNGSTIGGIGAMAVTGSVTTTGDGKVFGSQGDCTSNCSSSSSQPLPISLLDFNVSILDENVICKWSTASEINNDYFTIEKTQDGFNFEPVAIVDGAGNSTTLKKYEVNDPMPSSGVTYYRLKQTDFDGNYTYSHLEIFEFRNKINENFNFNIFPNPSTGENFTISLSTEGWNEVLVAVYDIFGTKYYSKVHNNTDDGENIFPIEFSHKLRTGVYMVTAISPEKMINKKIIIE